VKIGGGFYLPMVKHYLLISNNICTFIAIKFLYSDRARVLLPITR